MSNNSKKVEDSYNGRLYDLSISAMFNDLERPDVKVTPIYDVQYGIKVVL